MNHKSILLRGEIKEFNKPLTMGIINITPDSFYAGSRYDVGEGLSRKIESMISEGVDIIDIGAYSTRPGASDIPVQSELENLSRATGFVRKEFPDVYVSADTFRAKVAEAAVEAGADIINDIGGGNLDADMYQTIAALSVPYILMHSRGNPQTMKSLTNYDDVVNDVIKDLSSKIDALRTQGVKDVIVDPGFGFAKTIEQNFEMMDRLEEFVALKFPLLVGISRKSMIWKTLGITADGALNGTTVLNTLAIMKGASILRVHDVKEAREVIELIEGIKKK